MNHSESKRKQMTSIISAPLNLTIEKFIAWFPFTHLTADVRHIRFQVSIYFIFYSFPYFSRVVNIHIIIILLNHLKMRK